MRYLEVSGIEKILINNLLVGYGRKLCPDIKIADDNGVPNHEGYLGDKAEYETVIKLIEKWNEV